MLSKQDTTNIQERDPTEILEEEPHLSDKADCPSRRKTKLERAEFKNKQKRNADFAAERLKSKFIWYRFSRQNLKETNLKPLIHAEEFSNFSTMSTVGTNSNNPSATKDFWGFDQEQKSTKLPVLRITELTPDAKNGVKKSSSISMGNIIINFNKESVLGEKDKLKTLRIIL